MCRGHSGHMILEYLLEKLNVKKKHLDKLRMICEWIARPLLPLTKFTYVADISFNYFYFCLHAKTKHTIPTSL